MMLAFQSSYEVINIFKIPLIKSNICTVLAVYSSHHFIGVYQPLGLQINEFHS